MMVAQRHCAVVHGIFNGLSSGRSLLTIQVKKTVRARRLKARRLRARRLKARRLKARRLIARRLIARANI